MVGKLATLVTLFTLVLAGAAFASPADQSDIAAETEVGAGETGLEELLVGEHDQEETEFQLYLGPQMEAEIIVEVDNARVD